MLGASDRNKQIVAQVEQSQIKFIDLQFTDVVGVVKNVTIPVHELGEALENGIWFDGSSVEGFARIAESDMHLRPDLSTFAIIPWLKDDDATARLICDVYTPDGQPFAGDPRSILRRVVQQAEEIAPEFVTDGAGAEGGVRPGGALQIAEGLREGRHVPKVTRSVGGVPARPPSLAGGPAGSLPGRWVMPVTWWGRRGPGFVLDNLEPSTNLPAVFVASGEA